MSYKVDLTPATQRQFSKFKGETYERIKTVLLDLRNNPRPPGAVKLSGSQNDWRIRVGNYRILYQIDDAAQQVTVWRIAHRKEVYR
jgi:mRNA interferase RelE/StbE